jgi:DNA polymerase-3 subunit delta'
MQGILGHDEVAERFRRTLASGRLASTYLFVGPEGIGKRRFALALAKVLFCPAAEAAALAPCGRCESCRLFDSGNHPDLEQVSLLPGKSELAISQFVGDAEHRNQEGLCHRLSLRPFLGGRRVAIIDDADDFNLASANCLLKTLEEPPPHSVLILIGTSLGRQLPTIRSRAQIVAFRPLPPEILRQILLDEKIAADAKTAERLAAASDGSVTRARELADPDLWPFRQSLIERLSRPAWDVLATEKAVLDFVQAAGTEAALRRDRLRTVIGLAIDFYREKLRSGTSTDPSSFDIRHSSLALPALDACLAAADQVDRNANQALVVSHWLGRLAGNHASAVGIGT